MSGSGQAQQAHGQSSNSHSSHSINSIKLPKFHNTIFLAAQWWALFLQWVFYNSMSEVQAVSCFVFHLETQHQQWYWQLPDQIKYSLALLKDAFLKRFAPDKVFSMLIYYT